MGIVGSVWLAIAVVTVPGFLLGWVSGLKGPWAAAASLPLSFAVYGLGGWVLGLTEQKFTVGSAAVIWVILLLLAAVWRIGAWSLGTYRTRRESDAGTAWSWKEVWRVFRPGSFGDPVWILPAAGVVLGAWLIISRSLRWLQEMPGGLENMFQGWDVQWHANVVRWITEDGIASATRMGELQNFETEALMFYPVAFHAAAALLSTLGSMTPIAALNVMSIIVPGLGLPLSVALLAWKLVGNRGLTAQISAGLGAVAVFSVPALYWIGQYVGAWPYVAATAVSGIVLALFLTVPYRPVAAFAAAFGLVGVTMLHPSVVTTVVLGAVIWWLLHLLFRPVHRASSRRGGVLTRLRDVGWLAGAGVGGALLLLPQIFTGRDQAESVSNWDNSVEVPRGETWAAAFQMETRHVLQFFPDHDPTLLLCAAGVGGITLLLWRRNLWGPAFYGLSVWLVAHALSPFQLPVVGTLLDLIAGLHYSGAHRLIMPVAMLTLAAAGIGVAAALRLLTGGPMQYLAHNPSSRAKWQKGSAIAAVILAVPVVGGTAAWALSSSAEGAKDSFVGSRDHGKMVGAADLRAWDWLAEQPRAYEGLIAGEPADGHGWMYAYNGLPSLHRHYLWPTSPRGSATDLLYGSADLLGRGTRFDEDNENPVDDAAEEFSVNYFMLSPQNFWAYQLEHFELSKGLWTSAGVTPVYKDGGIVIFAVNEQFTDAELAELTRPGQSPDPIPEIPAPVAGGVPEP